MTLSRAFMSLLAVAAFFAATLEVNAQSGPVNGGKATIQKGNGGPTSTQTNGMTPERLVSFLQQKGYQTKVHTFNNGGKVVEALIVKNGVTAVVMFDYGANGQSMFLFTPLGTLPQDASASQLLALLEANHMAYPYHFSFNKLDNKLCLNGPSFNTQSINEQIVDAIINVHLQKIQQTNQVWNFVR